MERAAPASQPDACKMEQFYRSQNGDTWFVARDPATGSAFVRHQPNASSGGQVPDLEIGEVVSGPSPPEQEALLRRSGAMMTHPQEADAETEMAADNGRDGPDAEK